NVHPAKTEVRFVRGTVVHDLIRDAVRAAIGSAKAGATPFVEKKLGASEPAASPPPNDLFPESREPLSREESRSAFRVQALPPCPPPARGQGAPPPFWKKKMGPPRPPPHPRRQPPSAGGAGGRCRAKSRPRFLGGGPSRRSNRNLNSGRLTLASTRSPSRSGS